MTALIHHPPTIINKYLQYKLGPDFGAIPMFPTVPTDIESLSQDFTINDLTEGSVFSFNGNAAIYDRMFKMRRTPFPYIKCEQLLYYFNALREEAVPNLIRITQKIQDLLDNADDSAKDINDWAAANPTLWAESKPCFFHNFKIYQLEETRDIVDFGTARTYAGNKIIIDYDWHPINPS